MLTPQEVAEHSFGKATFNGYNMAAVDDFLDTVTTDYEMLYNDNTLLKQKLGVLSGKIREYQSTEDAMRKTLLAAQQMADDMVKQAEEKKAELIRQGELEAKAHVAQLKSELDAQSMRLASARNATATYVAQLRKLMAEQEHYLDHLEQLTPPPPSSADEAMGDIESAVLRAVAKESARVDIPLEDTHDFVSDAQKQDGSLYAELLAQRQNAQSGGGTPLEDPVPPEEVPAPAADLSATRRIDKFGSLDRNFGPDYAPK